MQAEIGDDNGRAPGERKSKYEERERKRESVMVCFGFFI